MTTCRKGVTENEKEQKEKRKKRARRTSISARWKLRSFGELSSISLTFLTRCIPGWSARSFSDGILQGPGGSTGVTGTAPGRRKWRENHPFPARGIARRKERGNEEKPRRFY